MKIIPLKKINFRNIIIGTIIVIFPFVLIFLVAWYLGFIFTDNVFVDLCIKNVDENGCTAIKGCDWKKDTNKCIMTSSCTDIRSQQNCAEGCTWDPNTRLYNSNIYGLCRPDFKLSVSEVGEETELKQ